MNVRQTLTALRPIESFPPIAPDAVEPDPMVRFEAVSKTYPAHRGKPSVRALQDIDFAVPRGSITGVIGRSGAGKSSLVRLINGLEKPTAGRVFVDDRDISGLAGHQLRLAQRSIGMIFQHFNLLSSRTAAGNIALPLEIAGWSKSDIAARVSELLDLVDIADKRDRYPSELSGGQKQRIGIARALATGPSVLLSDEATSALDPQTTRSILDLLANINRELGVTSEGTSPIYLPIRSIRSPRASLPRFLATRCRCPCPAGCNRRGDLETKRLFACWFGAWTVATRWCRGWRANSLLTWRCCRPVSMRSEASMSAH
jgi:D-methionine transport system ATP-binding protein